MNAVVSKFGKVYVALLTKHSQRNKRKGNFMERLTIRNSDGSVSQPTNLNWAAALERLAAYEDTGLTPEEVLQKSETNNRPQYVIKLDGDYYAGRNEKYTGMYNISGLGAFGAKKMSLETAEETKTFYEKFGRKVEIEKYDARAYLAIELESIIQHEKKRVSTGEICGYAILNGAQHALMYLKQL